jgi:hypothetical protein
MGYIIADKNKMIKSEVDYLMKKYWKHKIIKVNHKSIITQNIIINGQKRSGKDTFVEMCSRFTNVNNISSIEPIRQMAEIVNLSDSRYFLNDLKKLVNKYTIYLDQYIEQNLKENHLNFVHIREENIIFSNKYKNYTKLLLINTNNKFEDSELCPGDKNYKIEKYDHIIINNTLENLISKAKDFTSIYT